jgi:5-deoxy-glucuronate isomerase
LRFYPASTQPQVITPKKAGWSYSGLAILNIDVKEYKIDSNLLLNTEAALIPLIGEQINVLVDGVKYTLNGRSGVFADATDWLYLAPNSSVTVLADTKCELALATSVAESRFETKYVAKSDLYELRGAADASRQVRPFMHPDVFDQADRLMAVELITPDGNWSSFPPHRHDNIAGSPVNNEEIYYFRIGKERSRHGHPEGFGFHRTYTAAEDPKPFNDTVTVRDGDIYLVPRGFHGPCVAMPGYPMYYLNVLAGPNSKRSMDFCDDPEHAWLRESWKDQMVDPRLPWKSE